MESALAISADQRAGGKTVTITTTVADLTGRPPRTFAEFAHDHAAVFRGQRTGALSRYRMIGLLTADGARRRITLPNCADADAHSPMSEQPARAPDCLLWIRRGSAESPDVRSRTETANAPLA